VGYFAGSRGFRRKTSRRSASRLARRRPRWVRCRDVMTGEVERLTKRVLDEVRVEPTCRRLMTVPGVGPLTALAFRATIDQPSRFRRSRDVGARLGLTPRRYQSGEADVQGRISRCGDELARTALYEEAHSLLIRGTKWSSLRA
jgi:transposase